MAEDGDLVRRARRGEREAFDALFALYGSRLYAFARQYSNGDSAEDLVQEAFLAAFRSIGGFRGTSSLFAWLCSIVIRRSRDARRRPRVYRERAKESRSGEAVESLDLERSIAALPEDKRAAFLLVRVQQLTYDEAAEALGKPTGTVKWLVSEATTQLRQSLSEGYEHEDRRCKC